MKRTVRKVVLSVVVLVMLFVAAGVAYTFIVGRSGPKQVPKPVSAKSAETPLAVKPVAPAPNAPVGVAVGMITSPVTAGSNASITARTVAGAACTISVTYNGVASKDSGLSAKTADVYGVVNWTWTVEGSVPPGTWPVKMACTYHGRSGVVDTNLQVTKP